MEKLSGRLEALISRGYPREDVIRLSSYTKEEFDFAKSVAFSRITKDCTPVKNPICIYVGGQPGCGKSCLSLNIKNSAKNIVEIGIDNYRTYHPHYLEIEEYIKQHWKGKKESANDTPGNDIADFTHQFAGAMMDELVDMASKRIDNKSYNMVLEWGMREPSGPLKSMEDLKNKGYYTSVVFVCVNKDISLEACNIRADIMKDNNHIIRKVPPVFHQLCVDTLPDSINRIFQEGKSKKIVDNMNLCMRDGKLVWNTSSKEMPGVIFNKYLHNFDLTKDYQNSNLLASINNNKESNGIYNKIEELKQLKEEVINVYFNEEMLKNYYNVERESIAK